MAPEFECSSCTEMQRLLLAADWNTESLLVADSSLDAVENVALMHPNTVAVVNSKKEFLRSLVGVSPYREYEFKLQISRFNLIN